MSDESKTTEETTAQQTLPGMESEAAKRAAAAEKRAAELEDRERKRVAAEEKRKRDAEVKTVDEAKKLAAEAEAREQAALQRAEAAEKRIRDRIDERYKKLPDDVRKTIAEFKDSLSLEQWERMVDLESSRMPSHDEEPMPGSPPALPAGAGRRNHARDGRELHPKTAEILEALGVDGEPARKVLDAQTEVEGGVKRARFVYPPAKLKAHLRERALKPVLLSEENRRKILGL